MNPLPDSEWLPRWVNEPADWYTRRRTAWLEAVHAVRQTIYRRLGGGGSADDSPDVAKAVDDLIGLVLMRCFVQNRSGVETPEFASMPSGGRTARGVAAWLRERLSLPLLESVFDPAAVSDQPGPLFDAAAVAAGYARLLGQRFPVTALGDYHQLCLARPLHDSSGVAGANERRSRGVHFTPSPLVDYLTDATLRRLSADAASWGGGQVRILDPSCGSGVFLIAAARFLADFGRAVGDSDLPHVQRHLDAMASCIFGIDIDPCAVEWARRSLLLSAWQYDPAGDQSRLRIPDLRRNLAAADFLAETRPAGLPNDFDAVLGGPPFVRYSQLRMGGPQQIEGWRTRFVTARTGQFDLYMPFFEQAVRHLKPGGILGWSVANTFLRSKFGEPLRRFLGATCGVQELVEFEDPKVYADAITQIVLVRLKKEAGDEPCRHVWVRGKPDLRDALSRVAGAQPSGGTDLEIRHLPATACRGTEWRLCDDADRAATPHGATRTLKELGVRITQGVVTGSDPVFLLRVIHAGPSGLTRVQDRDGRQHLVESALLRPAVRSREVHGYAAPITKSHLLVPYDAAGQVLVQQELAVRFPAAHDYLVKRRNVIPVTRKGSRPFYAFRNDAILRRPATQRILVGMVTSGTDATIDSARTTIPHAGVLVLDNLPAALDQYFLLAVLNGPAFWSFVRSTMPTMGEGRHVLRRGPLAGFRVPLPSRSMQSEIAAMVSELLATASDRERTRLKNLIDAAVRGCCGSKTSTT